MLIVGAGSGLKQALVNGGTGAAIAKIALAAGISPGAFCKKCSATLP